MATRSLLGSWPQVVQKQPLPIRLQLVRARGASANPHPLPEEIFFRKDYDAQLKCAMRGGAPELEKRRSVSGSSVAVTDADKDKEQSSDLSTAGSGDDPLEGSQQAKLSRLSVEQAKKLQSFKALADRYVRQQVKLVVEPSSYAGVADVIKHSLAGQAPATDAQDKKVLFFYDVKLSGESVTYPQIRKPPLRGHYKKMMQGVLESRRPLSRTELHPQEAASMVPAPRAQTGTAGL